MDSFLRRVRSYAFHVKEKKEKIQCTIDLNGRILHLSQSLRLIEEHLNQRCLTFDDLSFFFLRNIFSPLGRMS